jgi:hypothetical protein
MTERDPFIDRAAIETEALDLPPPITQTELGARAMTLLETQSPEKSSRVRIPQPRLEMSIGELEKLYSAVADVIVARLEANPTRYSERYSLIDFAREIMQDTAWTRPDVETAIRRAGPKLSDYLIDIGEMRLRPRP